MSMTELLVMMVAEKPSIAETLAAALSDNKVTKRSSVLPGIRAPVFTYEGTFAGEPARFKVTSTAGHIYSLDFNSQYNDQQKTDPAELFSAPVIRCYDAKARLPEHLAAEGSKCDALVLWLDCDREGENICFEVIENVLPQMSKSRQFEGAFQGRIFRAKFSSLVSQDLRQAMQSLGKPNLDEAHSVDARQEIDLRLGVSFSRLMTKYFRRHFVGHLGQEFRTVTYGPCQMPTLWFCVHRHCQIQKFDPVPYWCISAMLRTPDGVKFQAEGCCGRIWDEEEATNLLFQAQSAKQTSISLVRSRQVKWERPLPLNTVSMLQKASEQLGLSPGDTMHYAEQLYLKGILSYPRTETNRYPPAFDVTALAQSLQDVKSIFADKAAKVIKYAMPARDDGIDHGDHPPITPVKLITQAQCKDEVSWGLYKLVCEHFLATIAPDCLSIETLAHMELEGVRFVAHSSRNIADSFSWCDVVGEVAEEKDDMDVASLSTGMLCSVADLRVEEMATKPPPYLSESELLGLMEQHGIGTDASMAQHINNILRRGYVWLDQGSRELVPAALGLALTFAFTKIDPSLAFPTVRSAIENECANIAKGRTRKVDVVHRVMAIFERKFKHFRKHLDHVPTMLALALAEEKGHDYDATNDVGCQWAQAMASLAAISLTDLLGQHTSSTLESAVDNDNELESVCADDEKGMTEDLEAILRVQRELEELGFKPSTGDEGLKKRVQQVVDAPPPAKRLKTFVADPSKTGLTNFHELCSHIGIKQKQVTSVHEEGNVFRGNINVVLPSGEACEFVSSQSFRKKKEAEHDVAAVATTMLLTKLEECADIANSA